MLSNIFLLSALCVTAVFSAPTTYSPDAVAITPDMKILSDYFHLLASKVEAGRSMAQAPVCNLAKAVLPASALPAPALGLTLKHVAIGRGTQNYTCPSPTNSTIAPTSLGAVATLYNASCIASTYPDLLLSLPNLALQFPTPAKTAPLAASNLMISGHHFFSNATTPVFDLNTAAGKLGTIATAKNSSTPAPAGASVGVGGKGLGAVPWLRLLTRDEKGSLQEVYRVNTAGGASPTTCKGYEGKTWEVQYAAEYWVFAQK